MMEMKPRSLKWLIISRLVTLQAVIVGVFLILIVSALWVTNYLIDEYEGASLDVLAEAVTRDAAGDLMLRPTPELVRLRSETSDLWFVMRDRQGHRLMEGKIPVAFAPAAGMLDRLTDARLRQGPGAEAKPDAIVKWMTTDAGDVQIMTGTQGRMSLRRLVSAVSSGFLSVILPIIILMGIATLAATPFVIRRALSGLGRVAAKASHIEFDRRGVQLPVADVPAEIRPLVDAVNDALRRLDAGYIRHQHFLAQAAHELRTPIAILNARVAALPAGADKQRLLEDAARLATLAGQLLDLQRLDQKTNNFRPVDIVAMAKQVVFDMAPLAVAAGYEMAFEPGLDKILIAGDRTALERALTNLVQNAIDHGGRHGMIIVRAGAPGWIEVIDEGNGIPVAERERIFEPFSRSRSDGRGAGLGLNLVREIMQLHDGHVDVVAGRSTGTSFKMTFPAIPLNDGGSASGAGAPSKPVHEEGHQAA